MNANDTMLRASVFCGAALAVVAASDTAPPEIRLGAGALAAGFGALVALLRPPSMTAAPPLQPDAPLSREERAGVLRGMIREQMQAPGKPADGGGR